MPPGNIGAGNGTRTRDIHLGKVVLYQLSYSRPITDRVFIKGHPGCQGFFPAALNLAAAASGETEFTKYPLPHS